MRPVCLQVVETCSPCGLPATLPRAERLALEQTRQFRQLYAVCLTFILLSHISMSWAQDSTSMEYRNKATFLANFPNFVEWPDPAFSSPNAPLFICIRGDFSFGTSLAEIARTPPGHGRRIEIRWVHKDEDLRNCQIAFVSRSESGRYAKILQAIGGAAVLTVGETPDFLSSGGALSFAYDRQTLRFEVNLAAASAAHLKISSRLLALAIRVVGVTEAAKS